MSRLPARPRLLAAAAALFALSVGLPWVTAAGASHGRLAGGWRLRPAGVLPPGLAHPHVLALRMSGEAHPMRLLGLVGLIMLAWAIRHGSRRAGWAAIGVAALAVPMWLNLGDPGAGRVCYAGAVILAVAGAGLLPADQPTAATASA